VRKVVPHASVAQQPLGDVPTSVAEGHELQPCRTQCRDAVDDVGMEWGAAESFKDELDRRVEVAVDPRLASRLRATSPPMVSTAADSPSAARAKPFAQGQGELEAAEMGLRAELVEPSGEDPAYPRASR
jgi:hypothetical protein